MEQSRFRLQFLADFSEAVGFRLPVWISLSPWSDGQSGRSVQSSEVLSLSPLSAAGCGGYLVLVVLLRSFLVLVDSGDRILYVGRVVRSVTSGFCFACVLTHVRFWCSALFTEHYSSALFTGAQRVEYAMWFAWNQVWFVGCAYIGACVHVCLWFGLKCLRHLDQA